MASGWATTLEEQIKGVVEVFSPKDKPSEIIYRPEKTSQNSYLYDIQNSRDEIGYEPQFNYIDMLKDMKKEVGGTRFAHLESNDVTI